MLTCNIIKLSNADGLDLPFYATSQSAGLDLLAAIDQELVIKPGEYTRVHCGFCMELSEGFEAQIRSRSGLASKHGVVVLNSPGTIDADYRGEIMVLLMNHGKEDFIVTRGMRIAQMVIAPYTRILWNEVDDLSSSQRGVGGFGSTGV